MRVLILGSGAVGQVLGIFLQRAGVKLGYYARPESAERLSQALQQGGMPLFQVSYLRRKDPIQRILKDYEVLRDTAACQQFNPDQIWVTTPSTVYYTEWFKDFLRGFGARTVVGFAPEGKRPEFILQFEPDIDFIVGGITFIAWQGDLEGGGGRPKAVNFWLPPFVEIPVVGAEPGCSQVVRLLKKGGLRASMKGNNFSESQAALTGVMTAFTAGVELAGWSFSSFRKSPWLEHAALAAREAVNSQLPDANSLSRTALNVILSRLGMSVLSRFLPLLFPFKIELYLKFHYTKTREQTLHLLELFIREGEAQSFEVAHLKALLDGLRA